MKTIVFLDTETTSLGPDRRPYEVGLIVREPGKPDTECQWFISDDDLDLGNADPKSLPIGGFYDRHPDYAHITVVSEEFREGGSYSMARARARGSGEYEVLRAAERLTRGAQVWCSNPAFDVPMLDARMRVNGICPSWFYHVEDIKSLARGFLHGRGVELPEHDSTAELAKACGVDPANYEAHTALGDCRLMRDLYDAVTKGARGDV